jgi:hypothetical protein
MNENTSKRKTEKDPKAIDEKPVPTPSRDFNFGPQFSFATMPITDTKED